MNLNSSFTGDDNLYVRIKTGNGKGWTATTTQGGYLVSNNSNGDTLKVDKIWYSFPVGERNTFWIGPEVENYYMHATTPSIYSPTLKQFTLGGNASAYGASTNSGFGWAYNADNGFAVSSNFVSQQTNVATAGLLTNEAKTSWATQVGYTKPQYSVSAILNLKYNGWADSYFGTSNGNSRGTALNSTNVGLRAWWRPQETGTATPSISVGYDVSSIDGAASSADSTDMIFVGLNWSDMITADDKIGLAFGQPQTNENDTVDPFAYEAYYEYTVNDATKLRTTVFGNSDRDGTAGNDNTGVVVETSFKF
ncbi:porin [Prochlorococcus marinus]